MSLVSSVLKRKITTIIGLASFALLIIIARLVYLQVNLTDHFFARSQKNFLRTEAIPTQRGSIVDRNGKLLATNRPVINIYWQGTGHGSYTKEQTEILKQLEIILAQPILNDPSLKTRITQSERTYKETHIASDITLEQLSKIEEAFPNHPNISIKTTFKRHYPHRSCASHVLGYLGRSLDIEPSGKMGLEKILEDILRGQEGMIQKTINSVGRKLAEQELRASLIGKNIQTTIDLNLQKVCEKVFPQKHTGSFILMEPESGDIMALVSRPDFDPNIFLDSISTDYWNNLQEKKPFINRAFTAAYPPGSIFKLVTISAALEYDLIATDSTWQCNGFVKSGKRKHWCHLRSGHGELNTSQALAQSCNILCYEIGKNIDIDQLAHYAHKFGLGQKTNILFPEKEGLIPTRQWKLETKGEHWWQGETLSASIGQSFLLVTPIQTACMISSIFTGYIPTPRLLSIEKTDHRPLEIAESTRDFLKQSMKLVVTTGTGKRVSKVNDMEVYAKTSTAQTSAYSKRNLGASYKEHAWFVAHITYKEHKPLVAVVFVENAGTSRVPTIIARNFLVEYKKLFS
jgi:penicillin-binding protein 2